MVSILIPIYNYNISMLVNEIHKQALELGFDFEIIAADDASTNNSIKKVNKEINNLINCSYIQFEQNKGRTYTRSFLAEKAQYDLLLFLDADVIPKEKTFLKNFDIQNTEADLIFGGISYSTEKPESQYLLRWKYGKSREAKTVDDRNKMLYLSIISQSILIKKDVFLKANDFFENIYGVDVLFCQNLEKMKVKVLHIDNPIIHLGLESNEDFIKKTNKALDSIYQFEKENRIPENYRPIQKAYLSLKNKGALKLFIKIIAFFEKSIYKNLISSSPSLFLFDLYRLYYYSQLKN